MILRLEGTCAVVGEEGVIADDGPVRGGSSPRDGAVVVTVRALAAGDQAMLAMCYGAAVLLLSE